MNKLISNLSHVDQHTNQPVMVDVSDKQPTKRIAVAQSIVLVGNEIIAQITEGDIKTKKGPVFQTAVIAGTMAVKKTAGLIPLCHPLPIESIKIDITTNTTEVIINCTVSVFAKTGVEMEALTGASIAALTIYDMLKAISHNMVIRNTRLMEKTGGKSDYRSK